MTDTWKGKDCLSECSDPGARECRCWLSEQLRRASSEAWNGIPPTGADITGWHWLHDMQLNEPAPAYWFGANHEWCIAGRLGTGGNKHTAKYYRYIAPCPVPEGYEP